MENRTAFWIVSVLLIVVGSANSAAAQPAVDTTQPLPSTLENQEMRILTVELAPGQASQPHRHNAHVFVYVLEGAIEMQVRGGELTHLTAGETFYENPDDIHVVSRNASSTEPARFLVHMLKTVGAPVVVPAP